MTLTFPPLNDSEDRGFTLIEVLVVFTVIALVSGAVVAFLPRQPSHLQTRRLSAAIALVVENARLKARESQASFPVDILHIKGMPAGARFKPVIGTADQLFVYPDGSTNGGTLFVEEKPAFEFDWLTGEVRDARR